jgi:hypothetical protein
MAGSAVTVTVKRTATNGKSVAVRGAMHEVVAGTFSVDDFEPPIGEVSVYSAYTQDAGDVPSTESSGTNFTVTQANPLSWIADPLDPSTATSVRVGSMGDRTMAVPSEMLPIIGSATPVLVSGVRQEGFSTITFVAVTLAELQALRNVLLQTPIVLFRAPGPSWDVGAVFLGIGDVIEKTIGPITDTNRHVTAVATRITRPDSSLAGPLHTYGDLASRGYTYRNLSDPDLTYLQLAQRGGL